MGSLGLDVIEIVIGLIFIYLLVSILVTVINEIVSTNLQMRSRFLKKAVVQMLQDEVLKKETGKDLPKAFYEHPVIKKLEQAEKSWIPFLKPKLSYISPKVFASVVIDLLGGYDAQKKPMISVKETVEKLPENSELKELLLPIAIEAEGDFDSMKRGISHWFDDIMKGVTSLYKRYNQVVVFGYGLLIAMLFNVDTVKIGEELSRNPEQRMALVQAAGDFLEKEDNAYYRAEAMKKDSALPAKASVLELRADSLRTLARNVIKDELTPASEILGIGWNLKERSVLSYFYTIFYNAREHFIGWMLTALAVSLGAPFWFDMLKRLMLLRGAVKRNNHNEREV